MGNEKAKAKWWTNHEEQALRKLWASKKPLKENLHLFPGRTVDQITGKARRMRLKPRTGSYRVDVTWNLVVLVMKANPKPMTTSQLGQAVGVNRDAARLAIKRHREAVHVGDWTRIKKKVEMWVLGVGKDEPLPANKTNAERQREYKNKQKRVRDTKRGPFATAIRQLNYANAA